MDAQVEVNSLSGKGGYRNVEMLSSGEGDQHIDFGLDEVIGQQQQ